MKINSNYKLTEPHFFFSCQSNGVEQVFELNVVKEVPGNFKKFLFCDGTVLVDSSNICILPDQLLIRQARMVNIVSE